MKFIYILFILLLSLSIFTVSVKEGFKNISGFYEGTRSANPTRNSSYDLRGDLKANTLLAPCDIPFIDSPLKPFNRYCDKSPYQNI
jgi:hypothetical protein